MTSWIVASATAAALGAVGAGTFVSGSPGSGTVTPRRWRRSPASSVWGRPDRRLHPGHQRGRAEGREGHDRGRDRRCRDREPGAESRLQGRRHRRRIRRRARAQHAAVHAARARDRGRAVGDGGGHARRPAADAQRAAASRRIVQVLRRLRRLLVRDTGAESRAADGDEAGLLSAGLREPRRCIRSTRHLGGRVVAAAVRGTSAPRRASW